MKIGNWKLKIVSKRRGAYLPLVLLISTLCMAFAVALITLANANIRSARHYNNFISSLDISEAGIDYYRWHLMHNSRDYCDGHMGEPSCGSDPDTYNGPYEHTYSDLSGTEAGTYALYIKPPALGEDIVTVKSVGRANNSNSKRAIIADLGMPSFSRYLLLANEEFWVGSGETTNGWVHSNGGVHFDGHASDRVSASVASYTPGENFGGDGAVHDGVWGDGEPEELWVFPVPLADFSGVSMELAKINLAASAGGIYLASSGAEGYYIQLNSDGTINISVVTDEDSAGIETDPPQAYGAPANGVIYVKDNVWVEGTYDRPITIASELPWSEDEGVIKIKDNLLYTARDGSVQIGLVAEGDIEVPRYAPNNLEIEAAMLSQKGHVWYPSGTRVIKTSISVYGSVSSFYRRAWTWVNDVGVVQSGYPTTTQTYDPFLLLNPPPYFPTTGSFDILSWREIIE